MKSILSTLLCATVLAATVSVATAADRRAPGFSLVDSAGQEHDLGDYRGKPVLLALIQTTCPHCAAFAEVLQRAQAKYGDKIAVVAIVNPPDDPGKVSAFIAGHKVTFPILFDSGQMAYSYVLTQKLTFPRLFTIDAAGMIRAEYEYSPLTADIFGGGALDAAINRLFSSSAPARK